jgi:hypothetical protein
MQCHNRLKERNELIILQTSPNLIVIHVHREAHLNTHNSDLRSSANSSRRMKVLRSGLLEGSNHSPDVLKDYELLILTGARRKPPREAIVCCAIDVSASGAQGPEQDPCS